LAQRIYFHILIGNEMNAFNYIYEKFTFRLWWIWTYIIFI